MARRELNLAPQDGADCSGVRLFDALDAELKTLAWLAHAEWFDDEVSLRCPSQRPARAGKPQLCKEQPDLSKSADDFHQKTESAS